MDNTHDFFRAIVDDGAFLLCVVFLAYVLIIVVPFLRRKPAERGDGSAFDWHFLVPCLNEEAVIERTVKRLVVDFPRAHVWCIDDGSTDATGPLIGRLAARSPRIHLVTRRMPDAQKGKGPALNAGWRALTEWLPPGVDRSRVIVAVVDADGRLDQQCLDAVAGPSFFGDEAVGAVQIQVRVMDQRRSEDRRGVSRLLVRLQDVEFAGVIAAIQTLRRHLGSVGMGGNGQFTRLSVLDLVAAEHETPWHGALLEDFELGVHVLLAGARTEYCHDTFVVQEGLPGFRRLVRQRCRWAQGSMQCGRYFGKVLKSPNIGNAAAIEIAYFLVLPWLQLVGGLLYAAATVLVAWTALSVPGGVSAWFDTTGWGLLPLFVLFGLGPIVIWGPVYRLTAERRMTRGRAVLLGLANWPYSYLHHFATWWAFTRVLRARHDWKKTERQVHAGAPEPAPLALPTPVALGSGQPYVRTATLSAAQPATLSPPSEDDWEAAVVPFQTGHHRRPRSRERVVPAVPRRSRTVTTATRRGHAAARREQATVAAGLRRGAPKP